MIVICTDTHTQRRLVLTRVLPFKSSFFSFFFCLFAFPRVIMFCKKVRLTSTQRWARIHTRRTTHLDSTLFSAQHHAQFSSRSFPFPLLLALPQTLYFEASMRYLAAYLTAPENVVCAPSASPAALQTVRREASGTAIPSLSPSLRHTESSLLHAPESRNGGRYSCASLSTRSDDLHIACMVLSDRQEERQDTRTGDYH